MLKVGDVEVDSELIARFWKTVTVTDGCWLWTGTILQKGYGQIRKGGKPVYAHRLSWAIANGSDIPDGQLALHKCNVRSCVRPNHLYLGSFSDNLRDQVSAGTHPLQRQNRKPGHRPSFSKLDNDKAGLIRGLHIRGRSMRSIAEEFGISVTAVSNVVHGRTYAA